MIHLSIDAAGCAGIAALITALATLVWAIRRDPKGGGRRS